MSNWNEIKKELKENEIEEDSFLCKCLNKLDFNIDDFNDEATQIVNCSCCSRHYKIIANEDGFKTFMLSFDKV